MIRLLWILVILFCGVTLNAGGGEYAVSNIPRNLVQGANVIKRFEQIRFSITETNKAVYKRRVAYTILNEAGDPWSYFSEGYDKLQSIESFEGTLFDANGNKIRSLKKIDIKDVSGSEDANLADDNRVKWHSFYYKSYPYTIEYEIEVKYKGTMFMPRWIPQERPIMSVEQSSITISAPANNPLHYKVSNYSSEPEISTEKDNRIYKWKVNSLPAVSSEIYSPAWHKLTTSVLLATENFTLEDYNGSNANWKDFGRFVYDLKKNRDVLPEPVRQKVHQLTSGVTDNQEKIRRLYDYMQQNTRYISVQLGVGGWQPFDAKYVGTNKYGDCKALSNFMFALLKEAGIRSVYTVTGRGTDTDYLIQDLPSSQFNHVILFVPIEKDTIWLECTSQNLVPGYIGLDNSNRYALAVDENGGTLVQTPRYTAKDNLQVRHIKATLDSEATLNMKVYGTYKGLQQDSYHDMVHNPSREKVKDELQSEFDFPTYNINDFTYRENRTFPPFVNETLDITVNNYATISGKRLFILPNIMTRHSRKLLPDSTRRFDIEFKFPYKDIDTVEISLPEGYMPEAMPKNVQLETPFGKYESKVKLDGTKLYYFRSMEHYSGSFPAKDFTELVKFYETIYKSDRNKVVLVKKE